MWDDPQLVLTLVDAHLARRPKMELRDVYKLLYQGVMGPEHLIASPEIFLARLRSEWDAVTPGPDDPLEESIRPDNRLFRVNLRPYRANHGDFDQLAAACLQTAQRPWGNLAELQSAWGIFAQACPQRYGQFAQSDVVALTAWLAAGNYPPIHHSESYCQHYRPAYRLWMAKEN